MFDPAICESASSRLRWVSWWLGVAIFLGSVGRGFAAAGSLPKTAESAALGWVVLLFAAIDGAALGVFVALIGEVVGQLGLGMAAANSKPSPAADEPPPANRHALSPLRPSSNQL